MTAMEPISQCSSFKMEPNYLYNLFWHAENLEGQDPGDSTAHPTQEKEKVNIVLLSSWHPRRRKFTYTMQFFVLSSLI